VGPSALAAQTTVTGSTGVGAFYRIDVPENWNGKLVIFNHGFELQPPLPDVFMGPEPLPDLQLAEGFAVAASSFRLGGYAVFKTKPDVKALLRVFESQFGPPEEILIYGESMGGLVSLQALETARLGPVAGVLSLCGMTAGFVPTATHIEDLRLIYDAVCSRVPGAFIAGGAQGLPEGVAFNPQEIEQAVDRCTGISHEPQERTPAQKKRLRRILQETTIPEDSLLFDMEFATAGVADLAYDPKKLNGGIAIGNEDVMYHDRRIDKAIERVETERKAARKLDRFYTPKGRTNGAKVVALHFANDGLLFVENLSEYAKLVEPEEFTPAVAVEEGSEHCAFAPAERVAAWEALLHWLDTDDQPSAGDIQAACTEIADQGLADGPCRIDPAYVIGDLYDRVKAR
jgi:pimeloyl-ACP methyl ester carboxylesterase